MSKPGADAAMVAPPTSAADRLQQMFHFEWWDKFSAKYENQIKDAKAVFDHLKLYVGLLIYTALGAFVSLAMRNFFLLPYCLCLCLHCAIWQACC